MMSGGMGGGSGLPPPPAYPGYAHHNSPSQNPGSSPQMMGFGQRSHAMMSPSAHGGQMGVNPGAGMHPSSSAAPVFTEQEEKQRIRFQIELEFVQCLGNPNYLHFLAQRGYFKDPTFINYLKYLLYWKEPKYVKFIKFPVCLHFLDLLQHEAFRKELSNGQCAKFLDDQVILSWQHYTRKRIKLIENAAVSHQQSVQGTPSSSVAASNTTSNVNSQNVPTSSASAGAAAVTKAN